MIRALFVGTAALAALVAAIGPAAAGTSAATASQRSALQQAATGTYTSSHGTIEFHDDGTATFSIRNCGVDNLRPGFGDVGTGCDPTTYSGRVTVRDHGYAVAQADGTTVTLDAYVDDDGVLHVGSGTVAPVHTTADGTRSGTIEMFLGDHLRIGAKRCTFVPAMKGRRVTDTCTWKTAEGRTILLYRAPDFFDAKKTETYGLVLVPRAGLLVDAGLVPLVFPRE